MLKVVSIKCPNCGASVELEQKTCEFCGSAILVTSFNSLSDMPTPDVGKRANTYRAALAENPDHQELNASAAMCFLKLKQYDLASQAFEKAMQSNFDNSEVFFYAAVAQLQGKIPFVHLRPTINKILSCLESAIMIENKGIYHYFIAYIKYDYFKRKYLNVNPNYSQVLANARQLGVTEKEISQLFQLLGTPRPSGM